VVQYTHDQIVPLLKAAVNPDVGIGLAGTAAGVSAIWWLDVINPILATILAILSIVLAGVKLYRLLRKDSRL